MGHETTASRRFPALAALSRGHRLPVTVLAVTVSELATMAVLVPVNLLRYGTIRADSITNGLLTAAIISLGVTLFILSLTRRLRASEKVIGEQKRLLEQASDERREMQARLAIADRMSSLGTLAGGVAHEINNPLTFVLANLDHISIELRDIAAEVPSLHDQAIELEDVLSETRAGALRVRDIVRDLRMFSRGADTGGSEEVDVRKVLQLSINMVRNDIRHRALLVEELSPVPTVRGCDSRLGQVFVNLLTNAAQAIPEGNATDNEIRVVTGVHESGQIKVEVHDTGSGMSDDVQARIFDPFFTTKPVGAGTGLGLSIVHGIVTAMGGTIEVKSRVGIGTTFRVLLAPAQSQVQRPPRSASAPPPPARKGGRVLVLDDEASVASAIRRILAREHAVEIETSGKTVVSRIAAGERFDAILCDLMMPDMTGMDVSDAIRQIAPEQADRMIFITGGAFTDRARQFLEESPHRHIEKPFMADELSKVVRSLAVP